MKAINRISLCGAAVLLLALPGWADAPEFQVNSYNAGIPAGRTCISTNPAGTSVIIWQTYDYYYDSGGDIFGQMLDGDGNLIGPEIHVNSTIDEYQISPSVAMGHQGNFVVTWQSNNQDGADGGIFARLFKADGSPAGGEIQVNTYTARHQNSPAVAMDWDSRFVVVWSSLEQDGDGTGVYGQRFTTDGQPDGPEFRVNTLTPGNQNNVDVAMDISGNFVVVFDTYNPLRVWGQRYNRHGTPQGPNFLVTPDNYSQNSGRVAMDAGGDFTIAWMLHYSDENMAEIFARRYTRDGVPDGPVFQVNTFTDNNQTVPDIAMTPTGEFVVVWESYVQGGLVGRCYDRLGVPDGPEIQLNVNMVGTKTGPRVGIDTSKHWLATWNVSGSEGGVYARTFGDSTASAAGDAANHHPIPIVSVRPNPFNPSTSITYELPAAAYVDLTVTDVRGRLVTRLYGGFRPEGFHTVAWDGLDQRGAAVSSGVYFYRLTAAGRTHTGKMLLVK